MQRNIGINITGTGSHNNTGQRCKAHGSINAFAVLNRRQRCTVAQVADDQPVVFTEQLGRFLSNIAMRRTMHAVTTDLMFGILLQRQPVQKCLFGHRLMKRRVKHRRLRHIRQELLHRANTQHRSRIMQRRQSRQIFNCLNGRFIQQNRLFKYFAAVNNSVPDRGNLAQIMNGTAQQKLKNLFQSLTVRRQRR